MARDRRTISQRVSISRGAGHSRSESEDRMAPKPCRSLPGGGPGCLRCRRRDQEVHGALGAGGYPPAAERHRRSGALSQLRRTPSHDQLPPFRYAATALRCTSMPSPDLWLGRGLSGSEIACASGALALAWAGLWLVMGSNIRTSTRYRSAARRQPLPGWGTTPLTALLCEERGAPLGQPQILRPLHPPL
jgi:hypothetical protein